MRHAGVFAAAIASVAITASFACVLPGCTKTETEHRTAVERGEALFSDPTVSRNSFNKLSCSTCHAASAGDARQLPGAPLAGALGRPSYWGGAETDVLRSVDDCLLYFMLDADGLDRSSDQAESLYAYLGSLAPAQTAAVPFTVVKTVDDVPKGDATRGQAVYERACKGCHGEIHTGQGKLFGSVTDIPDGTIAEHSQYGALELRKTAIEKIRHGSFLGYGGQMPPFSLEALPDSDLSDVLGYLGFDLP